MLRSSRPPLLFRQSTAAAKGHDPVVVDADIARSAGFDSFVGPRIEVGEDVLPDPSNLCVEARFLVPGPLATRSRAEAERDAAKAADNTMGGAERKTLSLSS